MRMSTVLERLEAMEGRYEKLTEELSKPEVISNQAEFQKLAKAHAELSAIVEKYRQYKKLGEDLKEARDRLKENLEADFRAMAIGRAPRGDRSEARGRDGSG